MKIIIFGTTGMVGQGILRECLLDSDVTKVLSVTRSALAIKHEKLEEIILAEPTNIGRHSAELAKYDACFFCLGVSSAGMSEEIYRHFTYDLTMDAAKTLGQANPSMTFIYVSGEGTDSTEKGGIMWARVKGRTENDLLKLPFKSKYMFRPGFIQPMNGESPKVGWYNILYAIIKPLTPILRKAFPKYTTSTELVGKAMLAITKKGSPKSILNTAEINQIAES